MGLLPTVSVLVARRVLAEASRAGVDTAALARQVGLRSVVLDDDDGRIPIPQYFLLWRALAPHVTSPDFGIALGRTAKLEDFGIVGYVMAASGTVREALERRVAYDRLIGDFQLAKTEWDDTEIRQTFLVPAVFHTDRHVADWLSAVSVQVLSELAGRRITPHRVILPHAPRDDDERRKYAEVFGPDTSITVGDRVEVACDARLLDERVATGDTRLGRYLAAQADQMLVEMPPADDEMTAIRHAIAETLRRGQVPTQQGIAKDLAVSVRTLQRRLGDGGTTFSALLDELRYAFARSYLERGELSNQEIAFVLGYAETSAFYRAFRRWSGGETPSAYRH